MGVGAPDLARYTAQFGGAVPSGCLDGSRLYYTLAPVSRASMLTRA